RCRLLQCGDYGSHRDDDVDLEPDELGSDLRVALRAVLRPVIRDRDCAVFDPPEFAQPLDEGGGKWAPGRRSARAQEPDGRLLAQLLRPRCQRPCSRAAEQRDELAPPHSITSSARDIKLSENFTPSALAVLRLITNSNLVGCMTGRSAGLAP